MIMRKSALAAMTALAMVLVGVASPHASATVPVASVPTLSGGVNGQVYATLVVGGTVFVGGSFTAAVTAAGASVPRDNLAAFDLRSGALLSSWRSNANGPVRSLVSAGGWLYVGGLFTGIGGITQRYLVRVNPSDGTVDPGFRPALNGGVLALQPDAGEIFAAGEFNYVGSVKEQFLAKLDASSGALDRSFSAWAAGWVCGLALSPDLSTLYVAGNFAQLSGTARTGLGAVRATSGAIVGPAFASSVNPMLDLALSPDGAVLYGGSGNWNNTAAAWSVSTGKRLWHVVVDGDVQAIAYYNGEVFFGFHDGYQGDSQTKLLAVSSATGAVDPAFRPSFNQYWGVRAISVSAAGLVIGGEFTWVSGVWARNWARFPATG